MYVMSCSHDGYHAIRSSYDRHSGLLVYHWACERCGARLKEARRERYQPRFDPHGNDRFLAAQLR
jgi:hypothetical protein